MQLDNRLSGTAQTATIILAGKTYEAREIIKAHGFRFDKNTDCPIVNDLGALWYLPKEIPATGEALGQALQWTQEIADQDITVVLIDGGLI